MEDIPTVDLSRDSVSRKNGSPTLYAGMSYCATDVEDVLFKPFGPVSMGEDFSYKYRQQGMIEESGFAEDIFDFEDLLDFDEGEYQDDLMMLPLDSSPTVPQTVDDVSLDDSLSSLEKALTDAVGDALSTCFPEDYNSDEKFIEHLLTNTEEIISPEHIEIASTSSKILPQSKPPHRITLTPQSTRVIKNTAVEATPTALPTLDTTKVSDNTTSNRTPTGKKRMNSCPCVGRPSPKRSISEMEVGTSSQPSTEFCVGNEGEIELADQSSQKTASTEAASKVVDGPLELEEEAMIESEIPILKKQIVEWKQAAQAAFEAARKIRAQMELEKFRADQAESIITQLTTNIRSKAARRRFERITKMRRSQSLTQDAGSSNDIISAASSNERSMRNLDDQSLDRPNGREIPAKSRKTAGYRPSQINDHVRLALRAKIRSVNASTLHTAKDIVQEAELLLKDLPITAGLKTPDY